MTNIKLILVAGGKILEGGKQAQYFVDIARWAYSFRKTTKLIEVFAPKNEIWISGIHMVLQELKKLKLVKDKFCNFTEELYDNAEDAQHKKTILECIKKATAESLTIIILCNHGSKFGFSLPKPGNIISKEDLIKNNSGNPTLLIYDACGGNIFEDMPFNWTVITHPNATFSFIPEHSEIETGIESIRIGGLLTMFFLSQIRNSFGNIISSINKMQKSLVNWEKYGTEEEEEKSDYVVYGSELHPEFEYIFENSKPIKLPFGILYAAFGNTIIQDRKKSLMELKEKLMKWNVNVKYVKDLIPPRNFNEIELISIFDVVQKLKRWYDLPDYYLTQVALYIFLFHKEINELKPL